MIPFYSVLLVLLAGFLTKIFDKSSYIILGYVDDLVVPVIGGYALLFIKRGFANYNVKYFLICYLLFFVFFLLGFLFEDYSWLQFLFQLFLELKFIFVFFACLAFYKEGKSEKLFEMLLKLIVLINIPFVIFQIFDPNYYNNIFEFGAHQGLYYGFGLELRRAAGIFWFTGELAFVSGLSCGYFFIKCFDLTKVETNSKVFLFLSISLLLSTLSRQEIFAFICTSMICYIVFFSRGPKKLVSLFLCAAIFVFIIINNLSVIDSIALELGLQRDYLNEAPRAVIFNAAMDIAKDNFPLGSGGGSFGGQASVLYDSDMYYEYGISNYWWHSHGLYLTDTFWPKVVAEAGYIGSAFFVLACLVMLMTLYRSSAYGGISCRYSFFSFLFLFVNSFSAPVFNSVVFLLLSFFLTSSALTRIFHK